MNLSARIVAVILVILAAFSTSVLAQSVTVGSGNASPGNQIVIPVTYTAGSNVGGVDLTVNFANPAKFSSVTVSCSIASTQTVGATNQFCNNTNAAAGSVKVTLANIEGAALTNGKLADITFTLAGGATPGVETLTPVMVGLSDPAGNDLNLNLVTLNNGAITVQGPAFSSNPAAGGGTEFVFGPVVQNAALASQNLTITNTGIGTLSGTCTEGADAGNVFTVTNGAYSAGAGLNDTVTVACSSAGAITTHTGTMSCTHNGGNVASPVVYDLSCQITSGPQPAYTSNPAGGATITFQETEAGDPNPPNQSVTITNTGDPGTSLAGTCELGLGDPQITLISAGAFSVAQGAAGSVKTLACDASVQGSYVGTLSCSHNGSSPASPVIYSVECNVTEAGAAVFASNPDPSSTIELDDGTPVVKDSDPPKKTLTFFNEADPGDQNLGVQCVFSGSSDGEISADPVGFSDSIVPGGNASVEFSCDTSATGEYTATYDCIYGNAGVDSPMGEDGSVFYNLSCDVRDPEAEVEITPVPGTPQNKSVPPGGSTSFTFDFTEVNDEGLDGKLHKCEMLSDNGFTTPPIEVDIGSGSTVTVTVNFQDPGGADSYTDTLQCEYSDTNSDDVVVSWPLTVTIGGDARFTVLKDFTDGNPGEVTVDLDCDTGLILDQEKTISEDGIGVTFVVTDFDAGELNCNVTERPVAGYSADYSATGDSASTDSSDSDDGCFYTLVAGGDENTCVISNSPDAVELVIAKEWLYPGSSGATDVSNEFEIVLVCDTAEIVYPNKCPRSMGYPDDDTFCKRLEGSGDTAFLVKVIPYEWPGGSCYAYEVDVDQAVEVDNGCSSPISVSAGSGNSCTITNTVFFEGIPTLNQYGMALMALLMLGMGFVAVRRLI